MADGDPRLICLLRAVNVGGRNRVPMGALREELARAGVPHVTTMLASGNLLVPWSGSTEILQSMIEKVILEAFEVVTTCMVVHPHEVLDLLAEPTSDRGELSPSQQLVIILDHAPDEADEAARELEGIAMGSAHLSGRFVVQRCPDGVSNAPGLVPFMESRWHLTATARNRRTIDRLLEAVR